MSEIKEVVYYLPGRGGQLTNGLGAGLAERGLHVVGRETLGDFRQLPFSQQVAVVAADLRDHFWHEDARVVAVSYGGYLFLHAQAELPPFPGKVLLLSPIVGEFNNDANGLGFIPPYAERLRDLAAAGVFPTPQRAQIHVGSEDWQSHPGNVTDLGKAIGIEVTVVPGAGHHLAKEYMGPVLDQWL